MPEWKHIIPVTKFFPEAGDLACRAEMEKPCKEIHDSLAFNRAFLTYVGLPEPEIEKYDEITGEIWYIGARGTYWLDASEFEDTLEYLYDWADRNRIWID